jgi:hypothetical protein
MKDAETTRVFEIRNVLTEHCGSTLTPEKIDTIVRQIAQAMKDGPCAWAFRTE